MTIADVSKANELIELIRTTEHAISNIDDYRLNKAEKDKSRKAYQDFHYKLTISEWSDGSGFSADLIRYYGNTKLLEVIRDELERQLASFKSDLEAI